MVLSRVRSTCKHVGVGSGTLDGSILSTACTRLCNKFSRRASPFLVLSSLHACTMRGGAIVGSEKVANATLSSVVKGPIVGDSLLRLWAAGASPATRTTEKALMLRGFPSPPKLVPSVNCKERESVRVDGRKILSADNGYSLTATLHGRGASLLSAGAP